MKRVTGIGGVFFKSRDSQKSRAWYKKHLGINSGEYGGTFEWRHAEDNGKKGFTTWGPFKEDADYFDPSDREFMINYRVDDLEKLIKVLIEEGVEVVGEIEEYEYGKFGWIIDPDGTKVELWEPNDDVYSTISGEGLNKSS